MTSPRSHIVDPDATAFYHCVSLCVRRAVLCGIDSYTSHCFEHRKSRVEDQLLQLAEIFAMGVYAHAAMSNHLRVVVPLNPGVARAWSPKEVAARWSRLFPVRKGGEIDAEAYALAA